MFWGPRVARCERLDVSRCQIFVQEIVPWSFPKGSMSNSVTQFQICQSTSQVPFLFSVVVGPQFLRTSCELQDLTKFLSACTFMYLQDKVPWVEATGLGSLEFQDLDRHGGPDNVEYLEKFTYLLLSFSKFPNSL